MIRKIALPFTVFGIAACGAGLMAKYGQPLFLALLVLAAGLLVAIGIHDWKPPRR